jgi:hypothetical protein
MPTIGPEIPPHFLNRSEESTQSSRDKPSVVGPKTPPHLVAGSSKPPSQPSQQVHDEVSKEESESDDDYGPALPPELLASRSRSRPSAEVVGPSLPQSYNKDQNFDQRRYGDDADEEDSDDEVGPVPLPEGISFEEEDGVREFMEREERRRKQIEVRNLNSFTERTVLYSLSNDSVYIGGCKAKSVKARRVDARSTVIFRLTW